MLAAEGNGIGYGYEYACTFYAFQKRGLRSFLTSWAGMLQFFKWPAGGPASDKSSFLGCFFFFLTKHAFFKRLFQCFLFAKFNILPPPPKSQNISRLPSNSRSFHLNSRWNPSWSEPNQVETCGQRGEPRPLHTNRICEQPEQPREARRGRRKHMGAVRGSPLSSKRTALNGERKTGEIFHFFALQAYI